MELFDKNSHKLIFCSFFKNSKILFDSSVYDVFLKRNAKYMVLKIRLNNNTEEIFYIRDFQKEIIFEEILLLDSIEQFNKILRILLKQLFIFIFPDKQFDIENDLYKFVNDNEHFLIENNLSLTFYN